MDRRPHPAAGIRIAYQDLVERSRPIVDSVVDLIGNTPLIRLHQLEMSMQEKGFDLVVTMPDCYAPVSGVGPRGSLAAGTGRGHSFKS